MKLYLSSPRAFNSTFHNAHGQAIYKSRTSSSAFGRTTTVSRIIRNEVLSDYSMRDIFGHLAQIEWKPFASSILRLHGREMRTRSFFRKEGWGICGRDRVFAAPDGRQYRWKLGTAIPELREHDDRQTLVARFNPGGKSSFFSSQMPSLEILPIGEHNADTILVSLIYIDKLREDD
ncbi:hypothetical protein DXG03_002399 [Asterophora parasitica]|uniref:DUF6593 domain-containing protein n=1 Tax=Asterophora parasitica TaxID=117018 RepID=A0A9P7GGJ4_9AGAR|nr:hypothetical protein DXG03_002399 [Asterophora parasitica]